MSYTIGYKKPPSDKKFKEGESGNPKGRPKGATSFLPMLEKELSTVTTIAENGKKKKMTRLGVMIKRLVLSALNGDHKALITILEVMRKTGRLEAIESAGLVIDDYQDVINKVLAKKMMAAEHATVKNVDDEESAK